MGRAAPRPRIQDRPTATDLHGPDQDGLRPGRRALKRTPSATNDTPRSYWISGRLIAADDGELPRELLELPGCYTTARVCNGRASWPEQHCRRLRRDARALGVGEPDTAAILRAFEELGRSEFGAATGVIQLKACRDAAGGLQLVATPRRLGPEPGSWRTLSAPFPHPGPRLAIGAKLTHQCVYERARQLARMSEVDEILLFDAQGRLVEGARSNIILVTPDDRLQAPAPRLGAVAGIALELLRAALPELLLCDIDLASVRLAKELIGINAVRAAVAITQLDGERVGGGERGPVAQRLREILMVG